MVPALSSHQQLNQHAPHFMGPPHAGQDNAAQLQLQVQLLQLQMQQMRQQQLQMHHMGPVSGVAFPSAHVPSLLGYPPVVPILPAQLQAQPPPLPAAPAQPQSRSVGAGSLPSYGFCSAQTTAACMQSGFSSQAPGGSVLPASASHTRGPRSGVHDTNSVADVKAGAVRAGGGALTGSFWGHLVALAKDPKGSRQLQAQLPRMADQQLARAAEELSPHLYELSRHTFGNYLVSKLASIPQMYAPLTRALKGNVVDLLQHAQGSRVVQAALASLPPAAAMELTSELDGRILECAMDTHGSWGVCIAFKHTRASFILKQMSKHMYALSTQQHGCRVVQSVLQAASSAHLDLSLPVSAILGGEIEYLAMHPFGNYAVQVSLRHCDEKQRLQLLDALLPRLLQLSTSKHGSNVAETVLMLADEAQISRASEQIFGNGPECRSALQQLVEHPFGNYVLQTLLRRMEPEQRSLAAVSVRAVTTPSNYGRSVLARVGEDDDIGEETAHSTSGAAFASSHVAMLIGSSGILDEVGRSC
ncbi:hypothetical protein AB1Y20_015747 [Prymnesium parvum]|uniref:PUM-HD domain-containing protein n=1 Tax=Prymnesium parvum TaxID=97485 RepID=A0AB34K1N8_PRYPA